MIYAASVQTSVESTATGGSLLPRRRRPRTRTAAALVRLLAARSSAAYPALILAALVGSPVAAESWMDSFRDPIDGELDASQWLLQRHGFLPVPLIITEPAVGYGGGMALVFFHDRAEQAAIASDPAPRRKPSAPPSVTAVFAAATENGTKVGGAGHLGVWRDNTLRYTGGVAAMSVNLTFYGGEDFPRLSDSVDYSLEGWGAFQQLVWRWGTSEFWLGPQLIYFDAKAGLQSASAAPIFDALNGDISNVGAGLLLTYDGRDNIFTPTRGLQSEWYVREHWGEFGDHFEYTQVSGKNRWYFNPGAAWVIGWRLDTNFTSGDVPFYALPSINQRGVAKGRYQGEAVLTTEVESRYSLTPRWAGVAFAGVGRAADSFSEFGAAPDRWAGGVGVRYLMARLLGLQVGVDVARGPEEWTFYLQVGSAWIF